MNKVQKIILIVLAVVAGIFLLYKYYNYSQYKNTNDYIPLYFKDPITIKHKDVKNTKTFGNMTYKDIFKNFKKEGEGYSYVKYDKKKNPIATYSMDINHLFIDVLSEQSFELIDDNTTEEEIKTEKPMTKYLKKHNITTDLELIKYVQRKFPFRNNIFTSVADMRNQFILNTFASIVLNNVKCITPIEGDIEGFIVEFMGNTNKEIHITFERNQYIFNMLGEEITNKDTIMELLESISFSK